MSKEIQNLLFELQDQAYKNFQCKLMPTVDPATVIGVRMPALRRLAKALQGTEAAAVFLNQLPHTYYEENNLHGLLICSIKNGQETMEALDRFLPYVNNWATCDLLVPVAFRHPEPQLLEEVEKWLHSDHPYTVRFGLGVLLHSFLDEAFSPECLAMAQGVTHTDYYVRMMQAWYFAEALVKQISFTIPVLTEHRLSPWVHNKTIQKAVESHRITEEQKKYLRTLRRK